MSNVTTVYAVHIGWNEHESAVTDAGYPEEEYFPTKDEAMKAFDHYVQLGSEVFLAEEPVEEHFPVDLELHVHSAIYGDSRQRMCNLLNRKNFVAKSWLLKTWNVEDGNTTHGLVAEAN